MTFAHPPLWVVLIAFLCALGPLVFFHELGHYLVARLFKVPAEVFSIGFGREIFGWTDKQGTRWKVAWLPLGGYVKFVGDMNPASAQSAEDIPPELRDRAFQFKPVWQRFLRIGDILIDSASETGKIHLDDIPTPERYADMVLAALRRRN